MLLASNLGANGKRVKKLAHVIVGTGKSETHGAGGRLEIQVGVENLDFIARNSGGIFMLQSGGKIPSSLGKLSLCF